MNIKISKEWLYLGIICLFAFLVILPIIIFGIPSGTDLPQHYQFAQTYYFSLVNGDGFPSWSDRENFGYGGSGIRFYPPLSYYVLAFARILTGNWFDASWLTFLFWMALGGCGVYFWARWWLSPQISALAAVFYLIAPHHLNQIYISFVYADFAGAAILPFCFAYLTRVFKREEKSDVLGLAICYGVLILTHLPSSITGSMCLAAYGLILLQKKIAFRQIIKTTIAVSLGLAASSYYWLAMVSEMSWLNHATEKYQSGHYYFGNRFFPLALHGIPTDYKNDDIMSDILTSISLLFLASAIVYFLYRKSTLAESDQTPQIFRYILPFGVFAFFMVTPLSYPIWKIVTPLQKIQFPMRWMVIVSMCGAIVTAAFFHFLLENNFLKQRLWIYTSIIFLSIFLLIDFTYMFYPSAFMPIERGKFVSDMRDLPDKQNYQFWWSVWSKEKALGTMEKVLAENRETTISKWEAENRIFTVAPGTPTIARVATFYYPHWKATVNEVDVGIEKDENGVMLIPLPAEQSVVKIFFQEPLPIRIASIFSIVVWLCITFTFLMLLRKKNVQPENRFSSISKE